MAIIFVYVCMYGHANEGRVQIRENANLLAAPFRGLGWEYFQIHRNYISASVSDFFHKNERGQHK